MPARQRREESAPRRRKPATTPEDRELEMVSLAMDLAETQIRDGSASSQVITHFLKAGSTREQLEQERIRHENELTKVKIQHLEAQERIEELYIDAIRAMRTYSGVIEPASEEDADSDVL
jgi:hypothetical protein